MEIEKRAGMRRRRFALRPRMLRCRSAIQCATVALAVLVSAQEVAAEIRVGLAAPLSGPMAPVGRAMQRALEAAVADINAAGGLAQERLALVVADDGCSAATAERAAVTLIENRPALVVGHPCSSAATRGAAVYRQAGILLIAVGARHPDVTKTDTGGALVLRLGGRDDRQGEAAARWLIARAPAGRIAIVHDRTAYARAIAAGAKATLAAAGVGAVADLAIIAGNREYRETISEIRAARAEAVLFAGFPDEAAIVAAGLAESGPPIPFLGTDSLATPGFAEIAQRSAMPIQVLLPSDPHPLAHGDDTRPASAAHARAALEAWLAATRRVGTTDATATGRALRERPIETPTLGVLRFDKNGDLEGEAFVPAFAAGPAWIRER